MAIKTPKLENERDRNKDGQWREKRDDTKIKSIVDTHNIGGTIPEKTLNMELGDYQKKFGTENLQGTIQHLRDSF